MDEAVAETTSETKISHGSRWPTVVLTALAGPIGSLSLALALAWLADTTAGGMASLAGAVIGLWLGAPILALVVFTVCLFTIARSLPLRRGIAFGVMTAAVVVEAAAMLVILNLIGGWTTQGLAAAAFAFVTLGLLSLGAYVALTLARINRPAKDPQREASQGLDHG